MVAEDPEGREDELTEGTVSETQRGPKFLNILLATHNNFSMIFILRCCCSSLLIYIINMITLCSAMTDYTCECKTT